MIESITFTDDYTNTPHVSHAKDVRLHEKFPNGIKFTNGLNLIVGNSGSGKTTMTEQLARQMACFQGGRVKMTDTWRREYVERCCKTRGNSNDKPKPNSSINIVWDGSLTYYYNPTYVVGLYHGHFDDDFLSDGLANIKCENSTGLYNAIRLKKTFDHINGNDLVELKKLVDSGFYVKATIPTDRPTIIIDEFERGLPLATQLNIINAMLSKYKDYQIIMVTHSPCILYMIEHYNANVIEFSEGYVEELRVALEVLQHYS